jgi:hypothetical protein
VHKRLIWLAVAFLFLLSAQPAAPQNRFIVRTTLGLSGLQDICLFQSCTVVQNLDGTVNQVFLVTTSELINPNLFLDVIRLLPGIVDAEADQLLSISSGLATLSFPPPGLFETPPVSYFGNQVWQGYAYQPAAQIVRVSNAQSSFNVTGTGVVADIDTGVDPIHPALANVLLQGYDFTRNQAGGSALLINFQSGINPANAAQAIAHAKPLTPDLGNGRLDLYLALGSLQP